MSSQPAAAIVRRFIDEFWNADNPVVADELIHSDYTLEGIGRGPGAVKRNAAAYRTAFPDLAWTIEQMVSEGDWVAVRLTLTGTHLGPLGAIPPSGRRVAMKEMAFWQVIDGQLRVIWSVGDALGLRVQLGALPASAWHHPVGFGGDADAVEESTASGAVPPPDHSNL
jgi:predicted ester cyclase